MSVILTRCVVRGARIVVRTATTQAQLDAIYRFRKRIYVDEMGLLPADHPYVHGDRLVDPYDGYSTQILATANGEPIGSARITAQADGALEVSEYIDLDGCIDDLPAALELTRFMVDSAWRKSSIGPMLVYGVWQAIRSMPGRPICLLAAKLGNLGQYYQNMGARRVDHPPFRYELTGCTYELVAADLGAAFTPRRASWWLTAITGRALVLHARAWWDARYRRGLSTTASAA